ncbi:helix-turn-helix domain-containing protein [Nonomuraea jiangxiensis]|uniref:AraC-type DNA-binding protein n=1 Tax=Nonomuraea jiangxiensis TaxID=633440 RepID=A0A1G9MH98_9ACTN|nr:AraC family transcriptional regulator [Nonomuraea jiangxiensis]SDL73371.1 AraC-type DNA-binding protein [Nonomuraea jiangxiensis]
MHERTVRRVAAGDGFVVEQVRFDAVDEEWSAPEASGEYRLMFVWQGAFLARVDGREMRADPTMAYLTAPGQEHSIAHRVGSPDVCTALRCAGSFFDTPPQGGWFPVTGAMAVAHRMLTAGLADPAEALGTLLHAHPAGTGGGGARAALAERARRLLSEDPALSLRALAGSLSCSPYHLSRVFHRELGLTMAAYRNRVRVLRAVAALEAGARDLAGLATELGFADQAHLTRTVRAECGTPPAGLRKILQAAAVIRPPDSEA